MSPTFLALVIGVVTLSACSSSDCPREGCDALGSPASADGSSRVAGVIAYLTDMVDNGCQECSFSSAKLEIWKSSTLVDSADAAKSLLGSSLPAFTLEANARYSQALPPGYYLLCAQRYCAAIEVKDKLLTTVNIELLYGPTRFIVFDAGSATSHDVAAIWVGL